MRVDKLTGRQRRLRARMKLAKPFVGTARFRREFVVTGLSLAVIAILCWQAWSHGGWDELRRQFGNPLMFLAALLVYLVVVRVFPGGPKSSAHVQVWWYEAPDGAACAVVGRVMDSGHPDADFWEVEELLQTSRGTPGADLLRQICADADTRGTHLIVRRGVRFIPGDRLSWDAGALAGLGFREGERWIVRDPRPRPAARSVAVEQRP